MFRYLLAGATIACLTGCANHQPTKQNAMGLPLFMDRDTTIDYNRPVLPVSHYVKWTPEDRLQYAVELDYISGMSQRDYLFEEPSQELFVPMVQGLLARSELQAKTGAGARYALQIEFSDVKTDAIGRTFAGKTDAVYRLVDRYTNTTVYENTIGSRFIAMYPGLNENDASFAYNVSSPGVIEATKSFGTFTLLEGGVVELWNNNRKLRNFFNGDIVEEVSQADWNDTYQSYVWITGVSAISGPALVLLGQLNPLNYISLQLEPRGEVERSAIVRNGNLARTGIAERSARKRAQQLNTHLLAQSLTYFVLDLASREDVHFTRLMACNSKPSTADELIQSVRARTLITTDNCMLYKEDKRNRGVAVSVYR